MGLRIQNNIAAINAHRHLMVADKGLSKSLERLSSGYRINVAADDAAGLAISERFRAQIASLKVAQRNVSEANALLQTAEGGMIKIGEILTRMKELATQAASGNAGDDIGKLSNEYNALVLEIDRISDSTKYANKALLDGTFNAGNTTTTWSGIDSIYNVSVLNAATGAHTVTYSATTNVVSIQKGTVTETVDLDTSANVNFSTLGVSFTMTEAAAASNGLKDTLGAALASANLNVQEGTTASFQVGYSEAAYDSIGITIDSVQSTDLGLAADDISTAASAHAILDDIETAISTVAESRGDIGAYQNRLGYAAGNLAISVENFQAAESVIRDVDMAAEMTAFTKNQILLQSGTAMLAQANLAPQQILALFG
ncbi:MAG: flagellin [Deltaproteobacteria bacterium]|nr:flagellin [Deltaproteobacteria bacterium]MBW2340000.1 flagellin [Deltaproteobacteria bacterium]